MTASEMTGAGKHGQDLGYSVQKGEGGFSHIRFSDSCHNNFTILLLHAKYGTWLFIKTVTKLQLVHIATVKLLRG